MNLPSSTDVDMSVLAGSWSRGGRCNCKAMEEGGEVVQVRGLPGDSSQRKGTEQAVCTGGVVVPEGSGDRSGSG